MRSDSSFIQVHVIERGVLRALCNGASAVDADLIVKLSAYHWIDAEHRIVFEAISKIFPCDALSLREQLPSQATRMGFPDVDWQLYFVREKSNTDTQNLVENLLNTSS